MTPHYVLDSFALLAFFRNERGASVVKDLLVRASAGECQLWLTVINAGEVYYMTLRKNGVAQANSVWEAMQQLPLNWVNVGPDLALNAAKIKAHHRLSYADAIAAALSITQNAVLVTGDPEFQALSGAKGFRLQMIAQQ